MTTTHLSDSMTYRGYRARLSYDPDDRILVGRVLDISDIIGFHGGSIDEFEQAFHEAVDAYLDACAKMNETPEKPASGKLMLRIPPEVHAAAIGAAKRSPTSLNQWAAKVLAEAAHGG